AAGRIRGPSPSGPGSPGRARRRQKEGPSPGRDERSGEGTSERPEPDGLSMTLQVAAGRRRASASGPFLDRNFQYVIVAPAILVLLLVGLFPLIYSLIVSFQGVTMME